MVLVNHLFMLPKTKRNVEQRYKLKTPETIELAKQYGKEYFDGPRTICYGGYKYDGRWVQVAKRFIDFYELKPGDKILDIGCAKGFLLHDFKKLMPTLEVRGLDVSDYAIENSMEDVKPYLEIGNASKLSYPDNSFDLVISINTIHDLPKKECRNAVREIQRVSRKHSYIVVDSYKDKQDKERILKWNVTLETILSANDWERLYKEEGYTGDYYWFTP